MSSAYRGPLLTTDDPHPVIVHNENGSSPFLFIADHAGNAIPQRLDSLGLDETDRQRHIAWDVGTGALGCALADHLDATFIRQHYSRLVIDCNRAPTSAEAILTASDATQVPGNSNLEASAVQGRIDEIHAPYQRIIGETISRRAIVGRETILISLHSFVPMLGGEARPWPVGVLYGGGETAFAAALLTELRLGNAGPVGDNEPYRMDRTDHTVPRHAFSSGLRYAEIEIRQDGLSQESQIERWCECLASALLAAMANCKTPRLSISSAIQRE